MNLTYQAIIRATASRLVAGMRRGIGVMAIGHARRFARPAAVGQRGFDVFML
jgi:hypothetical protein